MAVKGWTIFSFPTLLSRWSTARGSGCSLSFPCTSLSSKSLSSHWHPGGKREEVTLSTVSSGAEESALILSRNSLTGKKCLFQRAANLELCSTHGSASRFWSTAERGFLPGQSLWCPWWTFCSPPSGDPLLVPTCISHLCVSQSFKEWDKENVKHRHLPQTFEILTAVKVSVPCSELLLLQQGSPAVLVWALHPSQDQTKNFHLPRENITSMEYNCCKMTAFKASDAVVSLSASLLI